MLLDTAPQPRTDHAAATVSPWHPNVGARLSGYRYEGGAVPDQIQTLVKDTLFDRGVIVLEAGSVTDATFVEFVYAFLGDPVDYGGRNLDKAEDTISWIDSDRDHILRNHIWHVDGGYTQYPPHVTALYAHQIPGIGGDTIFSNAIHAYERFDPLFRAYLDTLTAVVYADGTGHLVDRILDDPERLAAAQAANPAHEKPVIRPHPVTGRRQIAVNESYTHFIKGVSRTESQNILNILFDAIKSPDNTARLTWNQGELAIWDNRVVHHRVIKDYDADVRRILHRVTVR